MGSKTFYLKYRPQSFSDLDLTEIRTRLTELAKSKKIPHAFLFAGPKGTGKTSAARVLAKAVNCASKKTRPCNRCASCQAITKGIALDLIEIDAASNRGIDDIRELREKVKLAPVSAQYKVYIIDEVHMLTAEAFNALLKTLEEPPEHVIFVLCTTAPEKLPDTIISRCTRFNFRKAKVDETIGSLKKIVKGEELKVEDGVLAAVAKSADGSFRDAQKTLEQLALSGKKITLKAAQELLQQTEAMSPEKLIDLLVKRDVKAALLEIDRLVNSGGDLDVYLHQILDQLRLALLAKVGLDEISLSESVASLSMVEIKQLIKLFSQAYSEFKINLIPQLPLELVVIEFCGDGRQNKDNPGHQNPSPQEKVKLGAIEAKWPEILAGVKPLNHSVEALLRAARPAKVNGEFLTIEVFYKFHKERLETEKCRQIVEEVAGQILGKPIKLACVLGKKETRSGLAKRQSDDIIGLAKEIFNS